MRSRLGRVRRINCNVRLYPSYTNIQYRVFRSSDVAHIRCFSTGTYEYCWHSARRGKIFNMRLLIQYSPVALPPYTKLSSWWRAWAMEEEEIATPATPRHLLRERHVLFFFLRATEKLGFPLSRSKFKLVTCKIIRHADTQALTARAVRAAIRAASRDFRKAQRVAMCARMVARVRA